MEKSLLVFGIKDKETEYSFQNKISLVEDKFLIQNLSRPNTKNQDSDLIIKSLNNTHISDVIQLKINVGDTGTFLVSFKKENLSEETRNELIEKIGKLKGTEAPTIETQTQKVQELLGILNEYLPIYSTFNNSGDIKINLEEIINFELKFPLLILKQPEKKLIFKGTKGKKDTTENSQEVIKNEYSPFALFDTDYLFVLFFSLLGAFSITASVFEIMNKEGIAAFLIILSVALAIILTIAVTTTIYKKGELRNPWLRYYLIAYVLVGLAIGVVGSFFICKGVLKTKIENFDYNKMALISSLISASLLLSLSLSRVVNIFFKIRLKNKYNP